MFGDNFISLDLKLIQGRDYFTQGAQMLVDQFNEDSSVFIKDYLNSSIDRTKEVRKRSRI